MQDEENLARRVRQRDAEAFGQIYDRYFDKIYRYTAFRVGTQTEAEDLTQQVFLKAWESVESYKWKGVPFSSWLFRIAHNQLVDCLRKRNKAKETPLEEAQAVSGTDLISVVEQKLHERASGQRMQAPHRSTTRGDLSPLCWRLVHGGSGKSNGQDRGSGQGAAA